MVKTFKKLTRHFNILKKVNKINRGGFFLAHFASALK